MHGACARSVLIRLSIQSKMCCDSYVNRSECGSNEWNQFLVGINRPPASKIVI